jgi:cytochrome d ubiquinol oxidase subunit II
MILAAYMITGFTMASVYAVGMPRGRRDRCHRLGFAVPFAIFSILTPFSMGTVSGAIASGRVPPGLAAGDLLTSWWNPTSVLAGLLAVGTCAYLAAAFLCSDAARTGAADLAEAFRRRGIAAAIVVGAVALGGIAVVRHDAPRLVDGLTHRGLALVIVSAVAGVASLALFAARRYVLVRVTAAVAVAAVLWGWAAAQYPYLLPPSTHYAAAAADASVRMAVTVVIGVGALLLVPSLTWLFVLFQRQRTDRATSF